MAFQLFSTQILVILAYALSVRGLTIPADSSSLERRSDGFLKLDFVVTRNETNNATLTKRFPTAPLVHLTSEYDITLNFGTPPQPVTVSLDTGSSDLWVPADDGWNHGFDSSRSSTFQDIGEPFLIQYVKGSAFGSFVTDTVSIPGGPSLQNFQFAEATQLVIVEKGILGISYTGQEALHRGEPQYPNFPLALKNAGLINKNAYSLYLNDEDATTGAIIFGGYDTEKYLGELVSLPVDEPNRSLGVTLKSLTTTDGNEHAADFTVVLDSGTTLAYLPPDLVSAIADAAGLEYDANQQIIYIDCNAELNGDLGFNFDGQTINVPLLKLVWRKNDGSCELSIQGSGNTKNYILLGDSFLRSAYVVYNLEDNIIQIAQAVYTSASKIVAIN